MALIDPKATHRYDVPHEADAWVEARIIKASDLSLMEVREDGLTRVKIGLFAAVITDWSYGEWPSGNEERLRLLGDLDIETHLWLFEGFATQLLRLSGLKDYAEKKALDTPSSPTTDPAEGDSPESSSI